MKVTGKSDKGLKRNKNQDNFLIKEIDDDTSLTVLCDGMGGAKGGLTASTIAINEVKKSIFKDYNKNLNKDEILNIISKAVSNANDAIFDKSRENENLKGMGTTIVCSLNIKNTAYIASIGDSRAYKISNNIVQITKDHSFVQEMIDLGQLSADEAKEHPQKNIITRALGVEKSAKMDLYECAFAKNDVLLICSDGLTNMVSDKIIFDYVRSSFDGCCESLINEANKNGGEDNITIISVLFEN